MILFFCLARSQLPTPKMNSVGLGANYYVDCTRIEGSQVSLGNARAKLQRWTKRWTCFAKQQSGRGPDRNFSQPRANLLVHLCTSARNASSLHLMNGVCTCVYNKWERPFTEFPIGEIPKGLSLISHSCLHCIENCNPLSQSFGFSRIMQCHFTFHAII